MFRRAGVCASLVCGAAAVTVCLTVWRIEAGVSERLAWKRRPVLMRRVVEVYINL